jgi:asparagine synthase (glutamine-hydrolysing)
MCGIWQLLLKNKNKIDYYNAFQTIKPRGPDRSHIIEHNAPYNIITGFHRLSIMDPSIKGDQPFLYEYIKNGKKRIVECICNGEIYNFKELIQKYDLEPISNSDCEIIHLLYIKIGIQQLTKELIGEFALIIADMDLDGDITLFAVRDPFGIKPLCITNTSEYINFSSELKGLVNVHNKTVEYEDTVEIFKPGYYMTLEKKVDWREPIYTQYYSCRNIVPCIEQDFEVIKKNIRNILTECVRCRLVADRPIGFLLSGGLDSSLLASIGAKILKEYGQQIYTFSIGMVGGTDEKYARMVAEHIGSIHTHITITADEALVIASYIVRITETYDITTNRASVPQYAACKWISETTNIKVLIIGDGMDELGSGYRYHSKAPSALESHEENLKLLENIGEYDVKRADRGVSDNGLEARVPYLDIRFTEYYLSLDPELRDSRNRIEKWLLRESFNNLDYLPAEVLFRRKEAFSDGISSVEQSWYIILQAYIETLYTDEEFKERQKDYEHCVPQSKEALYFRDMFEYYFGNKIDHIVPRYWLPNPEWCGLINEPSARVLENYE